jgi:hypothetical protein
MTLKPSQSGQPNAPHPAERRLHNLIYSLVYPAFLGSFLFGLLSNAASTAGPPWGILLACYFASQHVEGMTKGSEGYGAIPLLSDIVEIILMIAAFIALGHFAGPAGGLAVWLQTHTGSLLAAVFILPPVFRLISCACVKRWFWKETNAPFHWSLTLLSLGAAICSLWPDQYWSFWITAALLAIYAVAFQIGNDWVMDKLAVGWVQGFRRYPRQEAETEQAQAKPARSEEAHGAALETVGANGNLRGQPIAASQPTGAVKAASSEE